MIMTALESIIDVLRPVIALDYSSNCHFDSDSRNLLFWLPDRLIFSPTMRNTLPYLWKATLGEMQFCEFGGRLANFGRFLLQGAELFIKYSPEVATRLLIGASCE